MWMLFLTLSLGKRLLLGRVRNLHSQPAHFYGSSSCGVNYSYDAYSKKLISTLMSTSIGGFPLFNIVVCTHV